MFCFLITWIFRELYNPKLSMKHFQWLDRACRCSLSKAAKALPRLSGTEVHAHVLLEDSLTKVQNITLYVRD